MKKISLKLFAFLLVSMALMQGCTKSSDPSPADVVKTNLVRTWRLDVSSITIQGLPIAAVLPTAATTYGPLRLTFNAAGTYTMTGAELIGITPTGTWALDPANSAKLILNPGNVSVDLSDVTASSTKIRYSFATVGSPFAALPGASVSAAVGATLISP